MPEPIKGSSSRYMAGIDGLRALAVLAVIIYHLNYDWAPGGLLGVGIFFVLSGYLITDLLIAEWNRNGRLDMKDFWLRRARRLLPALFLMLFVVMAGVAIFSPAQLDTIRGDVGAAVLYVSNWWLVFHDVSYFEKFGPPSPLGHLWSLAVEEQFYVIWPLVLALGLRFLKRRGPIMIITLALAALSAISMAVLYEPGLDPSRVYYGTDTRVFGLLIGAALAMMWPSRMLTTNISQKARMTLDLSGLLSLGILLYSIWNTNQYDDYLYEGGLVLLSVVSAVLVAVLAHPASSLAKWMGCKPLRWIGVRSYGIYLWHYPVIVWTNPILAEWEWMTVPGAVLQLLASILLASLSWKYLEEPIRYGALGRIWYRSNKAGQKTKRLNRVLATGCAIALCVTYYGIASLTSDATAGNVTQTQPTQTVTETKIPDKPLGPEVPIIEKKPETVQKPATPPAKPKNEQKPNNNTQKQKPVEKQKDSNASKQPDPKQESIKAIGSGKGITVVGDSVMIDVAPYLEKLLPGIVVDAKIGRQMSQAPEVIAQLKAKGQLGNRVVIELGSNGAFSKGQLDKLLQSLDGVEQIILVNSRVPKPWESVVNKMLAETAAAYPHVVLVDWYAASEGQSSYFYKDGVHPNKEGSQKYAALVASAIAPTKPEKKPEVKEEEKAADTAVEEEGQMEGALEATEETPVEEMVQ
ncbi:peptidoglycan-N-acetylmuramate O-acetyltransferase [Brevibacillus sp. AG162]|uniref:acyltransferase family protein n=1 Tax=Brevibacillus sp. AG162 TaxID=2572910 RepID=UPI00114FA8F8|nr:acyltransferase family protein [Brevibacillus sp. AG162]TQK63728.1 peptidoglycan-N-acetylmuramate O-acetyltransferase [Brevibacillus sp. AG162]